jgi:8-oxo-dGTP pyrophosphatase MutT (NUDIX family)
MAEVKEFHGTGDSAVHPDKPMTNRKVVVVVMKHPTKDKYLCMKNKKFGWIDFVMGGIEGEETPLEAAARELDEESGYVDYEFVGELPDVYYDNFYAAHKDVNRHIEVHTVYGRLTSLEQKERSQEEQDIADIVWIDVAELSEKLHTDAHRWDLERVLAV